MKNNFLITTPTQRLLPAYSVVAFLLSVVIGLTIWFTGSNHGLFLTINQQHDLMPDKFWLTFNLLSYSKFFILPMLLIILTFVWRRDKLANVILLIIVYFAVFAGLKHLIGEARPYMVLPEGSFFWINLYENAEKSAYVSFPSGHTGNMAIFAFSLNILFFSNKKGLQFLMLALVIVTALARICTGWHWPLDVLASGLIGYLLVKICFVINLKYFKRKNHARY